MQEVSISIPVQKLCNIYLALKDAEDRLPSGLNHISYCRKYLEPLIENDLIQRILEDD